MEQNNIKDMFRERIVKKSIEILRSHGKSSEEIKEMMLKDFMIREETLDELLKTESTEEF